jgi:hypothetical protein
LGCWGLSNILAMVSSQLGPCKYWHASLVTLVCSSNEQQWRLVKGFYLNKPGFDILDNRKDYFWFLVKDAYHLLKIGMHKKVLNLKPGLSGFAALFN